MATFRLGSTSTGRVVWSQPQTIATSNFPLRGQTQPPKPEPPIVIPPPVEPPMPTWTPAYRDLLLQFVEVKGLPVDTGEEVAREWAHALCEQFAHTFSGQGFGHKSAGPGRPHSADALAKREGAKLYAWDVLMDAGGPNCTLIADPSTMDITGQLFEPVTPHDHIGEGPVEPPVEPTPTPPGQICWVPSDALFHQSLNLQDRCAAKWRALHVEPGTPNGHLLLDQGQAHIWMYRFFVEGWSPEAIYANVT